MKIKVILLEDVQGLGHRGDVADASRGYAENYLLPKKLAVKANAGELKKLEEQKSREHKKEEAMRGEFSKIQAELNSSEFTVTAKAGEKGKLFGSITTKEISELLKEKGFEIDKKKLMIEQPIKTLGTFSVKVHFLTDIEAQFELKVEQDSDTEREES